MQNLERRCSDMQQEIFTFKERFDVVLNKGLPSPVSEEDRLMDLEIFVKKVNKQVMIKPVLQPVQQKEHCQQGKVFMKNWRVYFILNMK